MKKKIFKFIAPVFSLSLVAAATLIGNSPDLVNASITEKTVFEDSFNTSEYKGKINNNVWVKPNVDNNKISQSAEGFTYLQQSGKNKGVEFYSLSTREKLSGIKSVQFDVYFGEKVEESSKWISTYFVTEQATALKIEDKGGLAYNGVTRLTFNQISDCDGASTFDGGVKYWNIEPHLGIAEYKTWYTFRYDIVSATQGTFNICLAGEEFDSNNEVGFTYDHAGASLTDAYFVLTASNEADEIRIDNLKIDNTTRAIDENFDDCNLDDEECPFEIIHNASHELKDSTYKIVDNCTLELKDAAVGDYIYSKTAVSNLTNGINDIDVLDVSLKVKITNKTDKVGIVFGYNPNSDSLFKNTVVFEISKNNGLLVEYDENGNKLTNDEVNKCAFTSVVNESLINISFNETYGVTVTENGSPARYGGADVTYSKVSRYLGKIAFVVLSRATNASEFYVDQFVAKANSYYKPITKSVSHGFNQEYWGPSDKPDFYVNETPSNSLSCNNGRLIYNGASDNTFFGSAHQYDDFILDYKIMNIYGDPKEDDSTSITAKNKWLGLDISRSKVNYSTYGSYCLMAFKIVPEEQDDVAGTFIFADDIHRNQEYFNQIKTTIFKNIPASLFRDITYSDISMKDNISVNDAVCVRYVSEAGKLSLYLKKASELNFTKYVTYSNINLQGYFAIACTGYTFLELDDFSMTNTSSIFECADTYEPEPIVITNTVVIYDNQNIEINLKEEIELNKGCGGSIISSSIIVCVASITIVCAIIIRKKRTCEK